MAAKLKHIALISDNYAVQGKFYEAAFGMRTAADPRPERAVTVGDGYVGLNINPRKPGRPAGLDHFGLQAVKGKHGNFHLTDGHVTLVLMPWRITDYEGTGIVRPGPDHLGFEVESLDAFKKRL